MSMYAVHEEGTNFGYPKKFGKAIVTYKDDKVVSIVFENGHKEIRHLFEKENKLMCIHINEQGIIGTVFN